MTLYLDRVLRGKEKFRRISMMCKLKGVLSYFREITETEKLKCSRVC